jgi:hypothetical protein
MSWILQKLKGGDLRSIGRAEEVVQDILETPALFGEVFEGMLDDDPRVRMRSADALEKVSSGHPQYLQPFKQRLITEVAGIKQQEVRWHVSQMFSYLELDEKEREVIAAILFSYIETDKSNIVKVFSFQTLAELAEQDDRLRPQVMEKLKQVMKTGSPALVNRAKKLLDRLNRF